MVRTIVCLVAIIWGMTYPTRSIAGDGSPSAVQDTAQAGRFEQSYTGTIKGNVSRVSMGNEYTANLSFVNGLRIMSRLGINESHYRLQDRRDETKSLMANLTKPFGSRWSLTGLFSNDRFFNRVVTFSNAIQDFTNNRESARSTLTYVYSSPDRLTVNASTSAAVSRSQQTFLKDQSQEGSVLGKVEYLLGNRVTWSGRGFLRKTSEEAEASGTKNSGLGVQEDSLGTSLGINFTPGSSVRAYYHRFASTKEFMDHPRGVFLEQQFSQNLIRETETRVAETIKINAKTDVLSTVTLTLGGEHSEAESRFVRAQKRNSTTTTDRFYGVVAYTFGRNATLRASLDDSETFHDLGSQSLGSYTDKRQSVRLNVNYPITGSLVLQLGAGTQLLQNFYEAKIVNPRDRDQLDEYVNLRITSSPFPKITTEISMSATQTQFVNIDASLSQNNRRETTYDFRPKFTYKINERIDLKQEYNLNIEFTEFDFTENDNFLDRNFLFANTISARLTSSLSTIFDYTLLLHDRGAYLRPAPGEERLLDIEQEDRRDQVSIGFRYQINPRLALVGEHDYTHRRDQFAGSSGVSSFKEGGLELGAEGKYDFGPGRSLAFRLKKVNRFGRFSAPEQEDYWIMDSSVNYRF